MSSFDMFEHALFPKDEILLKFFSRVGHLHFGQFQKHFTSFLEERTNKRAVHHRQPTYLNELISQLFQFILMFGDVLKTTDLVAMNTFHESFGGTLTCRAFVRVMASSWRPKSFRQSRQSSFRWWRADRCVSFACRHRRCVRVRAATSNKWKRHVLDVNRFRHRVKNEQTNWSPLPRRWCSNVRREVLMRVQLVGGTNTRSFASRVCLLVSAGCYPTVFLPTHLIN